MVDSEKVNSIFELFVRDRTDELSRDGLEHRLRVSIRISVDFYNFLDKWEESPSDNEIYSMVKMISFGTEIGGFFDVVETYSDSPTSRFAWDISTEYQGIREAYLRLFPKLALTDLQFPERLDCLQVLCEIQLIFLATNFYGKVGMR